MKREGVTCALSLVPPGRSTVMQIAPEVVVKLNLLLLLRLFDQRSEEKTSSKRWVNTGKDGVSGAPHRRRIGLLRKPIAWGLSVAAHRAKHSWPGLGAALSLSVGQRIRRSHAQSCGVRLPDGPLPTRRCPPPGRIRPLWTSSSKRTIFSGRVPVVPRQVLLTPKNAGR
jgi:hypothetical protein